MILIFGVLALGLALGALVSRPIAAYAMVGFAPFVIAFERGEMIPLMRPNEALLVMMWGAVVAGWMLRGERPKITINTVDLVLLALVVFGSIVPLLVSTGRLIPVGFEGVQYSFALWRLYALYFLVRVAIRTTEELTRLLVVATVTAGVVGVVMLLDGMNIADTALRLDPYFPIDEGPIDDGRGAATIGNAIGAGVYAVFGLLTGLSLLMRRVGNRLVVVPATIGCLLGIFGSGQVTAIMALGVGATALGLVTGRLGLMIRIGIPAIAIVGLLSFPLIERRIEGFDTPLTSLQLREVSELPGQLQPGEKAKIDPGSSWDVRVYNLEHYFLPALDEPSNVLFGVSPLPRADADEVYRDYVWIESGYVWLLWIGGVPLVLAFVAFVTHSARSTWRIGRVCSGPVGAAAATSFASILVLVVIQALDPHLTLRGTADLFFPLLAAALVASPGRPLFPVPPSRRHVVVA